MNNAIHRSGHLQNAITVDANSLEQVQVVMGPSSVKYGSDTRWDSSLSNSKTSI